jgi:hypothetical protein
MQQQAWKQQHNRTPTTVLPLAGTSTAAEMPPTVWTSTPHEFCGKTRQKKRRKTLGKRQKRVNITLSLHDRFQSVRQLTQ